MRGALTQPERLPFHSTTYHAMTEHLHPPNLGEIITAADVSTKGTGSYAADYINWCRVAHLLHEHAPGWQFHLRATAEGQHVWSAPNGTGYVVGFFTGPDGSATPDFPQAVMDNRNNAVPVERIDARDLTDTHRRCLCTAAAAQFGLAWQLWAKESLEDPHQRPGKAPAKAAAAPAQQEPSRDDLQRMALRRVTDAGLMPAAIPVMLRELGGEGCSAFGQLPDNVLRALAIQGAAPAKAATIERWNATAAAAEEVQGDMPIAWDGEAA